ncbi:uncharacterized protein LOC126764173 [Bactrocera neohumeralis]|uniref:uncharacterized protein LOC126764173 n=1 Tax=Bactrocera neohumeralis TaxID=98809 RepID=UPI00216623E3|nr:uncharacterized protein LOC126764173 [Bactrocera neohumeralis]
MEMDHPYGTCFRGKRFGRITKPTLRLKLTKISYICRGQVVPAKVHSFNSVELRAFDLLQINQAVDGIGDAQKFSAGTSEVTQSYQCEITDPSTQNDISDLQNLEELPPLTPPSRPQTSPKCSTVRSSKNNLLKMQVDGQIKLHKDCTKILKDVNYNLKSLVKSNKKLVEQNEEKIELERQKLKFAKLKHEYKIKSDRERNNVRIAKLKIKEQMLNVNTR